MNQVKIDAKTIREHLNGMSKESIVDCFLEVVNQASDQMQEVIVHIVEGCSGKNKAIPGNDAEKHADTAVNEYKPRMSDDLVAEKMSEILKDLDAIDNEELYFEAEGYEDYSQGYWGDNWVWEYSDPLGVGTVIMLFLNFAKDCVNDRKYEQALDIYDRVLELEMCVVNDYDGMYIGIEKLVAEELLQIDLKELALLTLYSDYQVRDKKERAADIYRYFSYPVFANIHVEDMRQVGREALEEENDFWEDWITLLSEKSGDLAARLLKEALLFVKGADGLAEMAKQNAAQHPSLFLEALKEYEINHEYQQMAELGSVAVAMIDKKYRIRSRIALKTAFAEYCLGHENEIKKLWQEAYLSDSNEVNYLRLFMAPDLAKSYAAAGGCLPEGVIKDNNSNYESGELDVNTLRAVTATNLRFLSGEFEKVKKTCVNPAESLGWSGKYIGTGIKLFLLYLYDSEGMNKAVNALAKDVSRMFGFRDNEDFYYLESEGAKGSDAAGMEAAVTTFWTAFQRWKQYFPMSDPEKKKYLSWAENIIDKRTTAIVGGKFRNHYSSVALLIMVLGEVKESWGNKGAKVATKERFRQKFPRHSSFSGALKEFL